MSDRPSWSSGPSRRVSRDELRVRELRAAEAIAVATLRIAGAPDPRLVEEYRDLRERRLELDALGHE